MKTTFFNSIAHIITALKTIRLERMLLVVFASSLLLFNTACGRADAKEVVGPGSYHENTGQQTELYDPVQPQTGGPNQFNDDTRYDRGQSTDKAKALIDRAQENAERVNSPQDYVDNLRSQAKVRERAEDFTENVKTSLDDRKNDLVQGTQQGVKNIQRNAERAGRNIQQSTDEARLNARQTGRELMKNTERALDDTANAVQNQAERAAQATQRSADRLSDHS